MKLEFSSIEEIREFMSSLKGTRGGKAAKDEGDEAKAAAPEPLQPPAGGPSFNPGNAASTFAPPAGGAIAAAGGPFAAVAPVGPAPEVLALVAKIVAAVDGAVAAKPESADSVTAWFRSQVGPEAAAYTVDQIKAVALPKMAVPQLESIAKLVGVKG